MGGAPVDGGWLRVAHHGGRRAEIVLPLSPGPPGYGNMERNVHDLSLPEGNARGYSTGGYINLLPRPAPGLSITDEFKCGTLTQWLGGSHRLDRIGWVVPPCPGLFDVAIGVPVNQGLLAFEKASPSGHHG